MEFEHSGMARFARKLQQAMPGCAARAYGRSARPD
jgi:hypothetical protein